MNPSIEAGPPSVSVLGGQDLTKLTVPQLKALCKEQKLTGYSKLGKPALVEKLIGSNTNSKSSKISPLKDSSKLVSKTTDLQKHSDQASITCSRSEGQGDENHDRSILLTNSK